MKTNGEIRRMRNAIITRALEIESLPSTEENRAYVRGLEFALGKIDREIDDLE